jgi:hypothetical protein
VNIHVHIERLVLDHDVPSSEVRGVGRSLQQELTRLLSAGGLSPQFLEGGALPSVRGGAIGSHTDRAATPLGSRVARAVYEGIGTRK